MPEQAIRRWSRRIVHPRLSLTTTDVEATLAQLEACLSEQGFRSTPAEDGFRAKRRPWMSWLAAAPASSCVLLVEPTSVDLVVVDVEDTGSHPAPDKVAEALTEAVRLLGAAGVEVRAGEWEPVP